MPESFDAFRYISYLRSRWKFVALSCAVALMLAATVSLLMPREYTATARIVIEPPAGDPRSSTAVSPIYLESLKTYEHFADSDNLFQKAIDKFNLRAIFGSSPIESMKRRVLKVETVRNTRILEISATLPDPRKAQAVAQFLATSTADLSRSVANEGEQDLLRDVEQQAREIRTQLNRTEALWAQLLSNEPVDQLQSSIDKSGFLKSDIQQQMLDLQVRVAEAREREKTGGAGAASIREEAASAEARLEEMRKQVAGLNRQSAEWEKLLATRLAHRDKAEADRKEQQTALAAVEARWRAARGEAGYRGERLRVIDQGIVPERPSSPNLPLNLAAALLLGLVLPLLYLTLEMNYREQRALSGRRTVYQGFTQARDE
jgi:uncharacterized protein involved in exopolysaccharide biosynthesis